MGQAKVLLAGDDNQLVSDIRRELTELGYCVYAAVSSVEAALDAVDDEKPDIVVMDITLPGSTGSIEAGGIIKNNHGIPVIYLVGSDGEVNLLRGPGNEQYGFVKKPAGRHDLKFAVETAVYRHRMDIRLRNSEQKYRYLVENANSIILRIDSAGRITFFNEFAQRFFGYRAIEIIGEPAIGTIIPGRDSAGLNMAGVFRDLWRHPERYESFEIESIRRSGERAWVFCTIKPLFDAGAEIAEILCVGNDITARKRAEDELKKSESRFRLLVEGSREVFYYIHDLNHVFEYISPSVKNILGYEVAEVEGHRFEDFLTGNDADALVQEYTDGALKDGIMRPVYTIIARHRDGRRVFLEAVEMPVVREGVICGIQGFARDITARILMEDALKESEDRYRELFDNANDIIYTHDLAGNFTSFNKKAQDLTGYSRDEGLSMNITNIVAPEYVPRVFAMLRKKVAADTPTVYEVEIIARNGRRLSLEVSTRIIYRNGKPAEVQGIARDVTLQKRIMDELRLSEEKFSRIFNFTPVMISLSTLKEGLFIDVNEAGLKLLGHSRQEFLGHTARELQLYEKKDDRDRFVSLLKEEGFIRGREFRVRTKQGEVRTVLCSAEMLNINTEPHILLALLDITGRKHDEERIKASLHEKETLLKEIHHRVKNNFQVIMSLLNLQARQIKDKASMEMFRDSQNRIQTMALIHERLYRSNDLDRINFTEYISILTRDLEAMFGSAANAAVHVEAGDIRLTVNQAIPCGLIINELVTNALKYAFPPAKGIRGRIDVRLEKLDENRRQLVISDNGVGLPENIDPLTAETLGLNLVNILSTGQLGGTLEMERGCGTRFIITFNQA